MEENNKETIEEVIAPVNEVKKEEKRPTIEEEIEARLYGEDDSPLGKMVRENPNKKPAPQKKSKISMMMILGCTLIGVTTGAVGGFVLAKNNYEITDLNVIKIINAYNILKENWFYGNEEGDIENVLTDMMLNSFQSEDNYTFYTPTAEGQNLSTDHIGFGIEGVKVPEGYLVNYAHSSGDFAKNGGKNGDIIISFKDGERLYTLSNHSVTELMALMSAFETRTVDCVVKKIDGSSASIKVKRSKFSQDTAVQMGNRLNIDGVHTLTIKISTFLGNPASVVSDILLRDDRDNPDQPLGRLVLDLRNNGGGSMDQLARIARLFVPKGKLIYSIKNRDGKVIQEVRQTGQPSYNIPDIRILQNGFSASASETLALALDQNNDAGIYGFTSYGKGIAQSVFQFKDGSAFRYTFGQVYGPDNKTTVHGVGLAPDFDHTGEFKNTPRSYNYDVNESNFELVKDQLDYNLSYLGYPGSGFIEKLNAFQREFKLEEKPTVSNEACLLLNYEVAKAIKTNEQAELTKVQEGTRN